MAHELTLLANPKFLYAVLKTRRKFEALRSFTLESGQEEIQRLSQLRKESADGSEQLGSPTRSTRDSSMESLRSPQSARSPSLSNVPEEGSAFAIGEDESEDDEHDVQPTPSQSTPSAHNSRTPSLSSIDDMVPMQVRGMSEKARGKLPAGSTSFSRVNSMSSMSSHNAAMMSTGPGFTPSAQWVNSLFGPYTCIVCGLRSNRLTLGYLHFLFILFLPFFPVLQLIHLLKPFRHRLNRLHRGYTFLNGHHSRSAGTSHSFGHSSLHPRWLCRKVL